MDNHDISQFLIPPPNDDITGYKYWFFPAPDVILALPNENQRRDKSQKESAFSQTPVRLGLPDVPFYIPGEGLNAIVI